jgi:capsular exopolysaccharide synthesis family protein
MEKLQKALKEARIARAQATGGPRPMQTPPAQAATPLELPPQTRAPAPGQPVAPAQIQARATPPVRRPEMAGFPPIWSELIPYEPNPDHLQKQRILTLDAQPVSNPFDVLRTKIFLLMQKNGWKRLAITSPHKACGKTTTACNLAVGLSRQPENRTMLFDMDLRRPGIAKVMGRQPLYGIKSMLTGEATPEDQMFCLRGNVALSMNRAAVPDSTQLLLAKRTANMFDRIQEVFDPDMMIFDLPPMFAADDARAFLSNVDCAMIVARASHTRTSQLDQCEREVAQATNVLGVVLNNCRFVDQEDQYYEEY